MSLTITTAPSVEPITTAQAKEYLRIDTADTSQDAVLAIQIEAVRVFVEEYLRRSLVTRTYTWEMNSRDMRGARIELPRPPVQSVTSLTVYDESGGSETSAVVAATNYQLIESAYLRQRNDGWDANRHDRAGTLVYVAGYGDAATDVPADIRLVMLRILALWFERRGDEDRDRTDEREGAMLAEIDHYKHFGP